MRVYTTLAMCDWVMSGTMGFSTCPVGTCRATIHHHFGLEESECVQSLVPAWALWCLCLVNEVVVTTFAERDCTYTIQ